MAPSFQDLRAAIQQKDVDSCRQLLAADPALATAADHALQSGLHHVAFAGSAEIAALLIDAGASVAARTVVGYSPLHYAAFAGHEDVFELLLEAGANIHAADDSRTTILHAAATGGSLRLVNRALEAGIEPGVLNLYDEAPNHRAAQRNRLPIIQHLISKGANPNPIDRYDLSLLHKAAIGGAADVTAWLVDQGHDIEARNTPGETPLHAAAEMGRENTVSLLIERGANVNCRTHEQVTPLHVAASGGHKDMIKQLLGAGANPMLVDALGRTPLHAAAIRGQADIVAELVKEGISPQQRDTYGLLAMDLAAAYGHQAVIDALPTSATPTILIQSVRHLPMRSPSSPEMLMWYLGHSGWAVRTQNHWIVLDYAPGTPDSETDSLINGRLRIDELSEGPVTVLVSHHHGDHFDQRVLGWQEHADVRYVFGWSDALDLPGARISGQETLDLDGLKIHAIPATDAGSAFLIEVDGHRIYHAGDHVAACNPPEEAFTQGLEWLAETAGDVDVAFLPVFGCGLPETAALRSGNLHTLRTLNPRTVFPMHVGWTGYFYRKFARWIAEQDVQVGLGIADQPGDRFLVRNGSVEKIWS